MLALADLSPDQDRAVETIRRWFEQVRGKVRYCEDEQCAPYEHTHGQEGVEAPVMSLGGEAGTGKTTVMRWLEAALACRVSFAVPTHKAARVLRSKLDPGARERVNTFHSLVYYPNSRTICMRSRRPVREAGVTACQCGTPDDCTCPRQFEPCGTCTDRCIVDEQLRWDDRPYLRSHADLLVIDESSMVSEEDLVRIRAFGVPVLLVGDHGQLPPVLARMNRWTANPDVSLTENHRQANDTSGIVSVALAFRNGKKPGLGSYGDGRTLIIGRNEPGVSDLLRPERYRERGTEPPAIICPWNKLRANVNKRFHGPGPLVRPGDRVVALARCTVPLVRSLVGPTVSWGGLDLGDTVTAHNGMQGTVLAVVAERAKTADLVVNLEEVGNVLVANVALAQFGRDKPLALNEKPVGARLWDYAYAITAHKAQGSEWDNVLVLEERPQDYARWCYTAVTRARSGLIVARY
jgi:exodeoxyribonuclease-5